MRPFGAWRLRCASARRLGNQDGGASAHADYFGTYFGSYFGSYFWI